MRDFPKPSAQALVPFVSVAEMMAITHRIGLERALIDLTDRIETDFRRWPRFDKVARVASHSAIGVIELMPTSDGDRYAFKYVNGHPANTRAGLQTVTGDCREYRLDVFRVHAGMTMQQREAACGHDQVLGAAW